MTGDNGATVERVETGVTVETVETGLIVEIGVTVTAEIVVTVETVERLK